MLDLFFSRLGSQMAPKRLQNAPKIAQMACQSLMGVHFLTDLVPERPKMTPRAQNVTIFDTVFTIYRILRPFCPRIARSYRILRGFVNAKIYGF